MSNGFRKGKIPKNTLTLNLTESQLDILKKALLSYNYSEGERKDLADLLWQTYQGTELKSE